MRRNLIAVIAGGVVLMLLFWFVLIKPKISDISRVNDKIEEAQRSEGVLRNSLRQLQEARQNNAATQARLAKLQLLLPNNADLPTFILAVQAAANADGIDLRSIAPSPPSPIEGATGIDSVSVTLQVSGGFFRMESFLARLEDLQRVVEVRSVSLAPAADALTGEFTLQGTITMMMYVVQPGARAPVATTNRATPRATASPSPSASPSPGATQ